MWRNDPDLVAWLSASRLDAFSDLRSGAANANAEHAELLNRVAVNVAPALANLQRLLAEAS